MTIDKSSSLPISARSARRGEAAGNGCRRDVPKDQDLRVGSHRNRYVIDSVPGLVASFQQRDCQQRAGGVVLFAMTPAPPRAAGPLLGPDPDALVVAYCSMTASAVTGLIVVLASAVAGGGAMHCSATPAARAVSTFSS